MKPYWPVSVFGFAALIFAVSAYAETAPQRKIADNDIACVESRLDALAVSDAGQERLATVSPLTIGEECGKDYGWTSRKSAASSLYAVSHKLQMASRETWAKSGYATDLPDRLKQRMNLRQLNEMVLDGKTTLFSQILSEELTSTGSILHADGRVDQLSLEDSHALGQKIGTVLMGLFMREEFQNFFDDAGHQSPDLFALMNAINPAFADIEARLK